jgi:virulence factor
MGKKLRLGMIGVGAIAKIAYLPLIANDENVEFCGVMAKNFENAKKAQRSYGVTNAVETIEQLVDLDLDCAFVLSPKMCHAEHVQFLLEHGLHVYCEKPLAESLKDARDMAATARKSGRILMVGFNRRYAPVYKKAKQAYERRDPDVIVAQKNRPASEYRATLENAIHMVDLMRFFCGECDNLTSLAKFKDPYYETLVTAQLRFKNGATGILIADRSSGQWTETVEIHGGGLSAYVNTPDSVTLVDAEGSHTTTMTPLAMGWAKVEDKLGFRDAVTHFFDCVRTGSIPLTNADDALKTHELMHEILKNAGLPAMD